MCSRMAKIANLVFCYKLAEEVRFELTHPFGPTIFKIAAATRNLSANSSFLAESKGLEPLDA